VWLHDMRVQCVESDGRAGFWRYDIGLYSAAVFRLAETGTYTTSLTHADDRFPLPDAATFHVTHEEALFAAQEQIRRDGRGAGSDAVAAFARLDRFPCPHDVFPDSVRIARTRSNPNRRLRNAEPFDRVVTEPQAVRSLFSAVCESRPAPPGISGGGPEWAVDYRIVFYQDGPTVLDLQISAERPQFLCPHGTEHTGCYCVDEWFWSLMGMVLDLPVQELFPTLED
jgi:hypothetical protein